MRSFLLVFYGNTGSSWLVQTIGSDSEVFVPGFEPLERWAWEVTDAERLDWMRTVFSPPEDRSGPAYAAWLEELGKNPHFQEPRRADFTYAGFKMHAHSIEDRTALLKLLLDSETKVVLLERRNRIKHALSTYRHHEEGKSQFEKAGVRPPSLLDLEKFHAKVEESVALHGQSQEFWDEAVAMLGPEAIIRVQYEDFVDGPGKDATMERVAGFLGIANYTYKGSALKKATPDNLATAVINFDELTARYAGTEFEQYLNE
ncbi:MAG: sulfotransferase [Acidimicrobiia bacterium]|nr:sulfotransferase [Acidimicrobiia bacterium]